MPEAMVMIVGEDHAGTQYYHDVIRSQGLRTLQVRPAEMAPTLYYRTLPNLIWLDGNADFYPSTHLLNFLDTLPPSHDPPTPKKNFLGAEPPKPPQKNKRPEFRIQNY